MVGLHSFQIKKKNGNIYPKNAESYNVYCPRTGIHVPPSVALLYRQHDYMPCPLREWVLCSSLYINVIFKL